MSAAQPLSYAEIGQEDDPKRGPFSRVSGLALGILAGIGGFVDFGGVVTSTQAGAQFRYALVCTLVVGIVGFAVYAEMSGRIAICTGRAMYDVIRDRLGARLALLPLLTTTISNTLTIVIEFAGMALAAFWTSGLFYIYWLPLMGIFIWGVIWATNFELLDNGSALLGLTMLVSIAVMIKVEHDWGHMGFSILQPTTSEANPIFLYFSASSVCLAPT